MDELKAYLNSLSVREQSDFARAANTSVGYLRKKLSSGGNLGGELCTQLEIASGRAVRRWNLRPHDWHRIWPELIGAEGAPVVPNTEEAA